MATKGGSLGLKRKGGPSTNHGVEKRAKKTRVDSNPKRRERDDTEKSSPSARNTSKANGGGADAKVKENSRYRFSRQADSGKRIGDDADGKTADRGKTSKESHALQKQLVQERKAAKPLADEVQRTKKLWEKLRRKSHVPKQERQELVDELFAIVTGRIKDFVLKHDAVRAVQTAIKYSTPAQRKQIAEELQGTYPQLAESRYAKFLIGKLLAHDDKDIRSLVIPEFYGKVRRLINHSEASWILDDVYRGAATEEQKAILLREWYGPEFSLFKPEDGVKPDADLSQILKIEPSKRGTIMKYLLDMVNQLIQKNMTGFTMLHDAMLQYFLNLKPESEGFNEFLELVKGDESGDLLKNMAFTKSGARLVCLLLAYSSSKDRKGILKTYKDTIQLVAGDSNAHTVILAAYDLVDDTKYLAKAIFPELLGPGDGKKNDSVIFLANNLNARTTILYLFEGMSRAVFPASHAADLEVLAEVHEIRKNTSKKDPEVRREELVAYLSPPLMAAIEAESENLVSNSFGCQFVADVLISAVGDKTAALAAIAARAAGDPTAKAPGDTYPPPSPHISLTPFGGRMFKMLISGGRFDKSTGEVQRVDPTLHFADVFYTAIRDHALGWATGPSSFAVVSLLEAEDFSSSKELRETLLQNKKLLDVAATTRTSSQVERSTGGGDATGGVKQGGSGTKSSVGNQGAKILLEKLAM